ncbi:MAG: hypothetical protein Q4B70_00890 [Lachnospiraceae bacterium]|nr:hypothetical protein [Lachnospiraceae bacterium]
MTEEQMTLEEKEMWKNAWSFPPEVKVRGKIISVKETTQQNYYLYESEIEGIYWYESDGDIRRRQEVREYNTKRKMERRRRRGW